MTTPREVDFVIASAFRDDIWAGKFEDIIAAHLASERLRAEKVEQALSMAQSVIALLCSMIRSGEDFSPSSDMILSEFKSQTETLRKETNGK